MSAMPRAEDRLRPWEVSWNGRTWQDMPGADDEIRKMNFYLYRTGHLKLEDVQYLGADDVVRTRTVTVNPLSFGKMGMAQGLESQVQRQKDQAAVRDAQAREAQETAKLRLALSELKSGQRGGLRQLALSCGVYYDQVLKFVRFGTKLGGEKRRLLMERLEEIRAGRFALPTGRRSVKQREVPAGHVPFKMYVATMAERVGMKPHSYYVWLQRNPSKLPPIHKLHGRSWWVPETCLNGKEAA